MARPTAVVARHTLAYGAGFTVGGITRLVLVPIIAQTLSAEEYGVYALLLAFITFLQIVFELGSGETLIRFHHHQPTVEERRRLRALLFVVMPTVDLLLALPLLLMRETISAALFGTAAHASLVGLAVVTAFFGTQLGIYLGHLRSEDRSLQFVLVMGLRGLTALTTTMVLVFGFDFGITGFLLGQLAAPVIVLLFTLPPLFNAVGLDLGDAGHRLKPLVAYALPLLLSALGMWALSYLDAFLLAGLADMEDVGIYRFAAEVALPLSLLLTSFHFAWPSFAFATARTPDGPQSLAHVFRHAFIVLVWASLALAVLRYEILDLLGATSFMGSAAIIPLWCLGICLFAASQVFATGLQVAGKTQKLPVCVLAGIVVNVVLAALLIPTAGALGCAAAKLLALLFLAALVLRESNREFRIPFDLGKLLTILAAAVGMLVITDAYGEIPLFEGILVRGGTVLLFPLILVVLRVVSLSELKALPDRVRK